ncbi:MAG TPA: TrmH family RNA methyltransferase [Longimicrobiales bacterium]|nr:TrmH family RNA methyltransferase [Longimicrobiales bacterium]
MGTPLSRVILVLDHPQDVVNIAGVIRVMMNFGIGQLRLVEPDDFDAHRIEGIAHRSMPLIEATTLHPTLEDAVADCVYVVGTTARPRTAGRNYVRPHAAGEEIVRRAAGGNVAILFGREDKGLFNEGLDLCHEVVIIPTSEYSSLNLAQAALVLAYETFLASGEMESEELPRGRRATGPPRQKDLEVMYGALRNALARIEFFKARKPEAIMRTLRTLITRAQPDLRETKLLAAMGFEVGHYIDRVCPEAAAEARPDGGGKASSPE